MTDKFYVISEQELLAFKYAVAASAFAELGRFKEASEELLSCYYTCTARPVEVYEESIIKLWLEVK
jgi:hypothetical protein